jgi:hypothetical protein
VVSHSCIGVHLAQAFVALACGGVFGLADQPLHGLAEVADLFFLLALAFAAHHFGAFAEQAAEGVGGFGQGGVVGAVHKVLRDDAALDVAVVAAADAQNGLVGAHVELAGHFGRVPVVFSSCSLACSGGAPRRRPRCPGSGATPSAIARRASASMKPRRRVITLGQLVLARQFGQRVSPAVNRLRRHR